VYGLGERRAENAQLERIAGKSAVFAVQFNQWLSSWWHPPQVFWLLAVLAALVGWGCRREARFLRDLQQHGDGHTPAL